MRPRLLARLLLCCWSIVGALALITSSARGDELEQGFSQPPHDAKPHTWWHWVSGNVSKEGITADLESMKRIGLGGAQCFSVDQGPKGPVPYGSDEWRALTKHAITEADRLGLELALHASEGWSETGGPWITPEQSMQKLVWSEVRIQGPRTFYDPLEQPETVEGHYRDVAVFAFPSIGDEELPLLGEEPATQPAATKPTTRISRKADAREGRYKARIPDFLLKSGAASTKVLPDAPPSEKVSPARIIARDKLVDLSDRLGRSGILAWDVPEGDWTIVRIGHTSTGSRNHPAMAETRGLECDKLSAEAVTAHFDGLLAKVIADSKPLMGRGLHAVLLDSWEAGNQNWTPKFRDEFKKRRGYDLTPWLPAMTGRYVESAEKTERFLWDVRRTIADLIAENHYGTLRALLKKHNLQLTAEAVGINLPTVADQLQCKAQTDVPMGEFWIGRYPENADTKEAASAAHVFGKQIASAEAWTARPEFAGWKFDPFMLKAQGDEQFTVGINRMVFHRFAHQPDDRVPGMTMGPWGTNFERTNTWWEPGRAWIEYLSRCQFLLQRGLFVADVLYYYGEGAPRAHAPAALEPQPPAGYDYDVCNRDVILTRASVKDGRIVLPDGMSYRLLVLPDTDRMTPQVAQKVKELAQAGATIYGPKPTASPSLADFPKADEETKRIAQEVWADVDGKKVQERSFGKGKIVWGKPLEAVLGVGRDFESTGSKIRFIHRRDGDADIYFVANGEARTQLLECTFRVDGKAPELWHADTGMIEPAAAYVVKDGRTILPLRLEPSGSIFVLFRKPAADDADAIVSISRAGEQLLAPREMKRPPGKLEIRRAVYGVLDEPERQVDVSQRLAGRLKDGALTVVANNALAGKDPAYLTRKHLRVEYVFDGKGETIELPEGSTLQLPPPPTGVAPFVVEPRVVDGKPALLAWEAGTYEVTKTPGKTSTTTVESVPQLIEIAGPWEVRFPPNRLAPDKITLEALKSWTEHEDDGVKHFSGTATYVKQFELANPIGDDDRLFLDLGEVKNLAEVTLNGKPLTILWKPPFRVDVTDAIKQGENQLEVKVTNLWPNRLIGDQKLPEEQRVTWAAHNPYTAESPLLESGLLGPVRVVTGRIVRTINAQE